MVTEDLVRLASLIAARNDLNAEIAAVIGRPALQGHIGEFIASRVFDIKLNPSAAHKASDGQFASGPLVGRSVNVKFYGEQDGLMAIRPDAVPDYYLVITGPKANAESSRGKSRPCVIRHVYLFDGPSLIASLTKEGKRLNEATGIYRAQWEAAEIWPRQTNRSLPLTDEQRQALALFEYPAGANMGLQADRRSSAV